MRIWFTILALLSIATPALALQNRPRDTCDWMDGLAWADCLTVQAGAPTIYDRTEHRERVFEAIITKNGAGILLQFIETRATGAHRLEVRSLFNPTRAIVVPLPETAWQRIADRLKLWPQDVAAERARVEKENAEAHARGLEFVCIHPVAGGFETNMAGPAPDAFFEACDQPWDFKLVHALGDAAFAAMPACKVLRQDVAYYDFVRLDQCTRLAGARADAARAVNAQYGLRPTDNDGKERHAADFSGLLAPDTQLSFEGGRRFVGRASTAAAWEATARGWHNGYLDVDRAEGRGGIVVITGEIYADVGESPDEVRYGAPYRQRWRVRSPSAPVLETWTIGRFAAEPRVY